MFFYCILFFRKADLHVQVDQILFSKISEIDSFLGIFSYVGDWQVYLDWLLREQGIVSLFHARKPPAR